MSDILFPEVQAVEARQHLHELAPGDCGTVVGFRLESSLSRRLIAMGVIPGRPVTVLRTAPFSDPMHVEVGSCSFSLRRSDAAEILVSTAKQP